LKRLTSWKIEQRFEKRGIELELQISDICAIMALQR
jgi:hypothetical protein